MYIRLNENEKVVAAIKEGLKKKNGFCPCRREEKPEYFCMCEEFRKQIEALKATMRSMEQAAASGAITKEFVDEFIDKILVTPESDGVMRLDIKIFTGESTQRYFEKLAGRTGHTFKKMIEAYEQGMQ